MGEYSNYQKLAAVVSEWARPAITQIASSKLLRLPFVQSLNSMIAGSGLVGQDYSIINDINPMVMPVIDAMLTPTLERTFSQVPDAAIPQLAHNVVEKMAEKGEYSILGGLITFEEEDIRELQNLLEKNLPVFEEEGYKVIK